MNASALQVLIVVRLTRISPFSVRRYSTGSMERSLSLHAGQDAQCPHAPSGAQSSTRIIYPWRSRKKRRFFNCSGERPTLSASSAVEYPPLWIFWRIASIIMHLRRYDICDKTASPHDKTDEGKYSKVKHRDEHL